MKCERCDHVATVHLTTAVSGKPVAVHLCERCANELEAEDLGHPRVVEAIGASQAAAARAVGPKPPPSCEGCGKVPSMHVTEKRRGERREHHLCTTCFIERLSDPREMAYHNEQAREQAEMEDVSRYMAEAEVKFGRGPENAKARVQWLLDCLRRRNNPPAV